MSAALVLPGALRARIEQEARAAFPRECCGLIEGLRAERRVVALHPTRNLAQDGDRFEIDPAEHIRLLRALRGTGRDIIGCYHSHPNGRADLSPRDRESMTDGDFIWLVAAIDAQRAGAMTAHVSAPDGWRAIDLRVAEAA